MGRDIDFGTSNKCTLDFLRRPQNPRESGEHRKCTNQVTRNSYLQHPFRAGWVTGTVCPTTSRFVRHFVRTDGRPEAQDLRAITKQQLPVVALAAWEDPTRSFAAGGINRNHRSGRDSKCESRGRKSRRIVHYLANRLQARDFRAGKCGNFAHA